MNPVLILGGLFFVLALIFKPELIAGLFFTLTIADINFEMGPANVRALIGLALFARTIISKPAPIQPKFFSVPGIQHIFIFVLYTVLITSLYDIVDDRFIKSTFLTFISVYCAYYYLFLKGNMVILKTALLISGVICFADLLYTYAVAGEFPIQRIFLAVMHVPHEVTEDGKLAELYNHNFFGQVCGMTFVFLFNEFINDRIKHKLLLLLMPIMALGVMMSTSRSSLLAMICITLFLMVRELKDKSKAKRVYRIFGMMLIAIFLSLFVFVFLQDALHLSSDFIESITNRLIDEPIQMVNKHLGRNYNVQQLDALDWREDAARVAKERFLQLHFNEQLFGIGTGGYIFRKLGVWGINPHNGMLLLIIESGIVGLAYYFYLLISSLRQSFRHPKISSMALVTIFVIIYCLGQNEELTSSSTLMIVAALIAETKLLNMQAEVRPPVELSDMSFDFPEPEHES